MSTVPGYIEKILAVDCETSGICFDSQDPSYHAGRDEYAQAVSFGFIVASMEDLEPIEKLYLEIKWDGKSIWNPKSEEIHGLSKDYHDENGVDKNDAALKINEFINKHWSERTRICLLGHNVMSFDVWFLRRLMSDAGLNLRTGSRNIDTFSLGVIPEQAFNSEQLFESAGLPERGVHNALEDIEFTLASAKFIREKYRK